MKAVYFRCKILDKHLSLIAQQHLETRFIKLDVEKAPFLTQRLGIRVIPTMGLIKDGKTKVGVFVTIFGSGSKSSCSVKGRFTRFLRKF